LEAVVIEFNWIVFFFVTSPFLHECSNKPLNGSEAETVLAIYQAKAYRDTISHLERLTKSFSMRTVVQNASSDRAPLDPKRVYRISIPLSQVYKHSRPKDNTETDLLELSPPLSPS
jgi:hypothetical protein